MHRRRLPFVLAPVLAVAVSASVLAVVAPAAHASVTVSETAVPVNGVFQLEGHGWGHGHGLSQYGAQGAATLNKTADEITSFYYPGTAKGAIANPMLRVVLKADNDADTQVFAASGLTVTDLATKTKATLPTGPTRWRSVTDGAGLHVQQLVSGAWKAFALGGKTVHTGPLEFGGTPYVRLVLPGAVSRDYRGVVRSVRLSAATVASVDVLHMESYLLGVVPRESSSSWPAAALQAQAIAARSYSEYDRAHASSSSFFDTCDTTACQVFGGSAYYDSSGSKTPLEPASTTQAVQATAGSIRTYQGSVIFSQFSASNGGWSTDGGQPYLIAQRDDWDGVTGSSVHFWKATVSSAQLQNRFPAVGTLLRMRITQRDGNGDWGGRVKTVVLEGVDSAGNPTSVTTTGSGVYFAHTWPGSSDGLRSTWWRVTPALDSTVVGQSGAPALVQTPGVSTGTLTATLRNTGSTSWQTSGLHLVVSSPAGQADPLVGNSATPGTYTGTASSIDPGSTAAFRFDLTGDGVPTGLQGRSYRLRIGSGPVFGATVSWKIPVSLPTYTATSVGGPTSTSSTQPTAPAPGPVLADGHSVVVPVGGSTPLQVSVRNTGNVSWPVPAQGPVRLGTAAPTSRSSVSSGPAWLVSAKRPSAVSASAPVAPGQTGTFGLTLYGNNQPVGVTSEVFEPLWEGYHWISGADTGLMVVRVNPAVSRLATLDRAPASTLTLTTAPNGTATLVVRLRNVGGSAWDVGTERLSASATPLSTSAWSSSTRTPALSRNVTRPGVASVYPGEVGEWQVPLSAFHKTAGTYTVTLRPVAPSGSTYGPTVSTSVRVVKAVFSGSLVAQAGTVTLPRASSTNTWFDVKNTGNTAWPVNGMLHSEALQPGGSPSRAGNWLAPSRPGSVTSNRSRPGATAVLPGEVARFQFTISGHQRPPQTTSEPFDAIWDGWLKLSGSSVRLAYRIV